MIQVEDIKRILGVVDDKDLLATIETLKAMSSGPKDYIHVESIESNVGRISFSFTTPMTNDKVIVNFSGEVIITARTVNAPPSPK